MQSHHVILSAHCRNRKERQKNFRKARRTGVDKDTVVMFNVATQKLEPRPIAKVYGIVNMYRDDHNPENVNHLEEGLSRLENDAAQSILHIHAALEAGRQQISIKRKELEKIRKFVYLMHYRRVSLLSSYFDENDPENAPLKDYFRSFCRKHNLRNKDDLWLYGLKYILDTPHHVIVGTGEAIQAKYGGEMAMLLMLRTRVDPDIENFHAVDYMSTANARFLGIWEAPAGEEFIVGSNSFGLWEGVLEGIPEIHLLFVVSPRVALVLRTNTMAAPLIENVKAQAFINSELVDVSMSHATSTYAGFIPPEDLELEDLAQALWKYRQTPAAQEDDFTFTITKLTRKQTHALNYVILLNLQGDVTFASPTAMAKTLQYYLQQNHPESQKSKYWFRSLLGSINTVPTDSSTSNQAPRSGIDIVLDAIANGTIEFRSIYDRAYRVYHLATDDVTAYNQSTSEIHQMTARAVIKMQEILPPVPLEFRGWYTPSLCQGIVKELPKEESDIFFALVGHQVDVFKVGPGGNDILNQIKYEAAIIGFTHWLAENEPWMLTHLLSFWVNVLV